MLIDVQADKVQGNLIFPYPAPIWPGLVGSMLDIDTGNFLTYDFGWKAGIDSFLEVREYAPNISLLQITCTENFNSI